MVDGFIYFCLVQCICPCDRCAREGNGPCAHTISVFSWCLENTAFARQTVFVCAIPCDILIR